MNKFWVLPVAALFASARVRSRDVPALQDICARQAWSFCSSASGRSANSQSAVGGRPLPAADVPPSNSSPAGSPSKNSGDRPPPTVGEYCTSFEPHFTYYCDGDPAKGKKAADFCSDYLANCLTLPAAGTSAGGGGGPSAAGDASAPPKQAVVPCTTYTPHYTKYCTQAVSNPQLAQFCQNYQTYCLTAAAKPPTPPATGQQSDTSSSSMALTQIKDKCAEYQTAAKLYCTGPSLQTQPAQTKQYCDLFRQYCVATGLARLDRRKRGVYFRF